MARRPISAGLFSTGSLAVQALAEITQSTTQYVLDREAALVSDEARTKGLLAGREAVQSGRALQERPDVDTVAGRSFNAAARQTYLAGTQTKIRNDLAAAAVESEADPDAFRAKVNELRGALPQTDELAPIINDEIDATAGRYLVRIQQEQRARAEAAAKAEKLTLLDSFAVEARAAARSGDSRGLAGATASHDTLVAEMLASGQLTPLQAAAAKEDRERSTVEQAVFGQLDAAAERGSLAAYRFARAAEDDIREDVRDPVVADAIIGKLRRRAAALVTEGNAVEEAADRRRKEQSDAIFDALHEKALFGGGITIEEVAPFRTFLDAKQERTLLNLTGESGGVTDDPDIEQALRLRLSNQEDIQGDLDLEFKLRTITESTYKELSGANRTAQKTDGPGSDYKQVTSWISSLSPQSNTNLSVSAAKGEVRRRFDRWRSSFSQSINPKTGEPFGRDPSYDEQFAVARQLARQTFKPLALNELADSIGADRLPSFDVRHFRDDKSGRLDFDKTMKAIVQRDGLAGLDKEEWPEQAVKDIERLKSWHDESEEIWRVLDNIGFEAR